MSSNSQTPSKGPPPLPTFDVPDAPYAAPLRDVAEVAEVAAVEEAFFLEGIDGHAESLPSEAETIVLAPIGAQPLELEEDVEPADVEDPARARRRHAARIGVVCGAALMVGVAGASAFLSPHGHERSPVAVSTSAARAVPVEAVENVASAPAPIAATTPASPEPQPAAAAITPPQPPQATVRPMTASAKATGAAHPRAAGPKKGAAPTRGAKPSPAPPKASTARASRTRAPATRVATSKPPRRGPTSAKASG